MINHIWSIVCLRSVIDRETNSVSLFDILEELTVQGEMDPKKIIGTNFEVVSLWMKSDRNVPEKGKCRASFVSPSGEKLKSAGLDILLEDPKYDRMRTIIRLGGMPLPEQGMYSFTIEFSPNDSEEYQIITTIPCVVNFTSAIQNSESKQPDL